MMRFLKSFFLTLRERFSKSKTSSAAHIIGASEILSRYIFSTRYFSRNPPRVKAEAYMPSRGEVSVFRIDGLSETAIWEIGSDVARKRDRTLYARGDTKASDVMRLGLDIRPNEPPPRHADLVGWPENDKPRQKLIALQVAAVATLVLKP
jgi:hypothetical protein